jgi:hypothetical protein
VTQRTIVAVTAPALTGTDPDFHGCSVKLQRPFDPTANAAWVGARARAVTRNQDQARLARHESD